MRANQGIQDHRQNQKVVENILASIWQSISISLSRNDMVVSVFEGFTLNSKISLPFPQNRNMFIVLKHKRTTMVLWYPFICQQVVVKKLKEFQPSQDQDCVFFCNLTRLIPKFYFLGGGGIFPQNVEHCFSCISTVIQHCPFPSRYATFFCY